MSDLVKRLRHEAYSTGYKPTKPWDLLVEAADRIEVLEAALRPQQVMNDDLVKRLRPTGNPDIVQCLSAMAEAADRIEADRAAMQMALDATNALVDDSQLGPQYKIVSDAHAAIAALRERLK